MNGGYQIIDISTVTTGTPKTLKDIFENISKYNNKPVLLITGNNSGVFAEFNKSGDNYVGAYIGSDAHCYAISITPTNVVTVTDKGNTGGGGGGTSDYTDLDNKPSINNVTLSGNKTSSDLGLQSELTNGYTDLDNKPSINNVTLSGNKTSSDLGLQSELTAGNNIVITNNIITATAERDIYSTTERVVGQWIDGKPVYQKVYTGTITSGGATVVVSDFNNVIPVDTMISMEVITQSDATTYKAYSAPYYAPTDVNDMLRTYVAGENGNLVVFTGNNYPSRPCDYVLILKYTKTTD